MVKRQPSRSGDAIKTSIDDADVDLLARTLFGESRGDGQRGMEAVASVILNRRNHPTRWPNTTAGVVRQRLQFSAWNAWPAGSAGAANRRAMDQANDRDPVFRKALRIARKALAGELEDRTRGADHFHATTMPQPPRWARGQTPTATIGRHRFFKLA